MTRGRKAIYQDPLTVSIKCERNLRDIMRSLKIMDPEVYAAGAFHLAKIHAGDLSQNQIHKVIQLRRQDLQNIQEEIVSLERVAMDAGIRENIRKKKNIETRLDDRGQEYVVVLAE